jgi:hypothetical protein
VTPHQGSKYGGTLINITGINFSPVRAQNQAYVGFDRFLACDVLFANTTFIQCKTRVVKGDHDTETFVDKQQYLDVSQRISEIASCDTTFDTCQYMYSETYSPKLDQTGNADVKYNDQLNLTITSA